MHQWQMETLNLVYLQQHCLCTLLINTSKSSRHHWHSVPPGYACAPVLHKNPGLALPRRVSSNRLVRSRPAGNNSMAWLWTFGAVPELDAAKVQEVSESIMRMAPEERAAATSPRIIDVRTAGEYDGGHIAGAVNASFLPPWSWASNIEPHIRDINTDTPIICICLSAHRSIGALKWLKDKGYTNVTQLAKGMQDWRARGLPEVK